MLKVSQVEPPTIDGVPYKEYMTRKSQSYTMGCFAIVVNRQVSLTKNLTKLIPPVNDPSPRNTQNDLKPGATPFLQ